jgi:hypothetical protein
LGKGGEGLQSRGHWAFWGVIPTHCIEGNLHKNTRESAGGELSGGGLESENLTIAIAAGRWIDDMGEMKATAFVAAELRQVAAMRSAAHA